MTHRPDATEAQVRAARPMASTWLSANAGSGKTRVLTDRVARLLLAQVPPERILCLTYTKAAASEMQNRLFQRLGAWAMLDNDELRHALNELGESGTMEDQDLRRARTLFAAAIEAPGGLKIQTIHSFCSSILRRFPLEAGVSPQFTEIEDRAAALLRDEIIEEMALGAGAALIHDLARKAPVHDLTALTGEIANARARNIGDLQEADVRRIFDLAPDTTLATLLTDLLDPATTAMLQRVIETLSGQSATYQKHSATLASVNFDHPGAVDIDVLRSVFFYSDGRGAKIGKFPQANHKSARDALAADLSALDHFMERLERLIAGKNALDALDATLALNRFAHAFLKAYDTRKQELGWLDFDDLILKTRDLLNDPKVAAWVLYRLDGGIDHILVDEAQDTSPEQWDVIERLSEDFTSGLGARADVPRTIFVVGDKKQSIYSFQGADPREFDRMRDGFASKLAQTNTPLNDAELQFSFRSASPILELVDEVFVGHERAGFAAEANHIAFHQDLPGRVDIWPEIVSDKEKKRGKATDTGAFIDTTDKLAEDHHTVRLARRIASEIARMIGTDGRPPEVIHDMKNNDITARAVSPGDILILVQNRSTLFEEIIRACKNENLPIAGADRLKVAAELAVRDIRALMSFLATPEDDYSLAVTLKSPLFGWDEDALFKLAHGREGYLWPHMRNNPAYASDIAVLRDLRDSADFLRPYDLIERILTRHNGRALLIGRLGAEAEDGIDALLSQALAYERSQTPSLTGFLTWMETDGLTIKRQMALVRDEIRVMTVHGAKGLEAPIVIMPDTAKRRDANRGSLLELDGILAWNAPKADAPKAVSNRKDESAERSAEERMRLLYVAMTRAEKWLIVAAAGDVEGDPQSCWYAAVKSAAERRGALEHAFAFGAGLRIEPVPWGTLPHSKGAPDKTSNAVQLPDHFTKPAAAPNDTTGTLSPSDLGGAKALPSEAGLDEEAAKERGTHIHLLLEHFAVAPPESWDSLATSLLPTGADIEDLKAEAIAVLQAPNLQFASTGDGLSEVPVSAVLPQLNGRSISGVIDRLIITEDIWIIDYKSNAAVPSDAESCPEGLLRQMGAYRAALLQIFPGKTVRTGLIWTRNASFIELPDTLTSAALHRAGAALTIDELTPHP